MRRQSSFVVVLTLVLGGIAGRIPLHAAAPASDGRPESRLEVRDATKSQRIIGFPRAGMTSDGGIGEPERGGRFAPPVVTEIPEISAIEDVPAALAAGTLALWRNQGATVASMRELTERSLDAHEEVPGGGIDRYLLGAGDLDADGLDDAIAMDVAVSGWGEITGTDLLGIKGTDGTELWRQPIPFDPWGWWYGDYLLQIAPDLDGDGAPEVLQLSLTANSATCLGAVVAYACAYRNLPHTWSLEAIDGSSGDALWTRRFEGSSTLVGGAAVVASIAASKGTAVAALPLFAGDRDGVAGEEVMINLLDVRSVAASGVLVSASARRYDTNVAIVAGSVGTTISTSQRADDLAPAFAVDAGDAVGDSTRDLAWYIDAGSRARTCTLLCGSMGAQPAAIEMIDGATGTVAWSWNDESGDLWALTEPIEDIDGDGIDDIVAIGWFDVALVSGATGAESWRVPAWNIALAGNLDGGPGQDLFTFDFGYDDYEYTLVNGIDGVDGSILSEARYPEIEPTESQYTEVYVPGDLDGDGALDLGLVTTLYGTGAMLFEFRSGASNASIPLNATMSDVDYAGMWSPGDVDADGTDDVLLVGIAETGSSMLLIEELVRSGGGAGWTRGTRLLYDSYFQVLAGDADATAGVDIFSDLGQISWGEESVTLEGLYEMRSGLTGERAWRIGNELTPPPGSIGTARLRGTVTLEEAYVPACVDVYTDAGDYVAERRVSSGSSYTIGRLAAGTYHVRFTDCWESRHIEEWYDGASTRAASTPIVVGDGEEVTGIDADLLLAPVPPNDTIRGATILEVPSTTEIFTGGATSEAISTGCDGAERTVWYRITPTATGSISLDTTGTSFVNALAVYAGYPTRATQLDCSMGWDDEYPARIQFNAIRGVRYYVMAGGYWGEAGTLVLNASSV